MTSLHRTWLVLLQVFAQMHSFESQLLNEWISSIDADGTQRWQSVSDFIPVQSKSFGSIAVGEIMSIEFDFVWWGRTNLPSAGKFEMFFRVGFDASISRGCDGQGARYPSFWLTGNNVDTMHVSVSNGTQCQPSLSLNSYGSISKAFPIMYPLHSTVISSKCVSLVAIHPLNHPHHPSSIHLMRPRHAHRLLLRPPHIHQRHPPQLIRRHNHLSRSHRPALGKRTHQPHNQPLFVVILCIQKQDTKAPSTQEMLTIAPTQSNCMRQPRDTSDRIVMNNIEIIKVREMQKKRKSSPKYHMELNGADMEQMPSKLELNGDSKSSNHGENANRNYLQSPLSEEHQANGIDSVYLSLDKYKSDSGPHSHLSISVMNMKDATPTPAVSPNENNARHVKSPNNDKEIALVMGNVDDITPVQTVRETIGDKIDSEEDEKGYKQANIRRKDKKEYAAVKRQRMEMDKEEPYEQELDGYGVGLYTTPIVRNYGPYRKNTENTEGYESDNSDNTDFYNSYNGQRMKKRGYEWIKRTLTRVDSQNYDEYVKNFERHKVADTRLGDLLPEDWKELIPVIGPRNEFKRLWAKYNSNLVFKTNGELMEDEETTVPEEEDIAVDLGNDLLAQLISNNDEALLMNERKQKENEQSIHLADDYVDKDVAKLTFDDIKNKFGSHSASNKNDNSVLSSVLSSFISNSEDEERKKSLMSAAESMEISQSYEESQSKSDASGEDGFNYKMRHNKKHKTKTNPIPVAIAEDKEVEEIELKIDQDRLKPGTNSFISPPISPPQYTSHKVYDNPIIARGKNPSLSSSSQSLLSDYSSMSQPPIPDDVDPEELEQPLKEDQSDSDDETLGIPKFHADVSDDSDSSSDESDTETESDAKSDTDEHKEFGQEVDVTIENAIYEDDDEYETDESDEDEHRDDDDEESLSIDMPNSDEDGEED
eukprot:1123713_1